MSKENIGILTTPSGEGASIEINEDILLNTQNVVFTKDNPRFIIPKVARVSGDNLDTSATFSATLKDIDLVTTPEVNKYAHILDVWNKDRTQRLAAIEADINASGQWLLALSVRSTDLQNYYAFRIGSSGSLKFRDRTVDYIERQGQLNDIYYYQYNSGLMLLFGTGTFAVNMDTITLTLPVSYINDVYKANVSVYTNTTPSSIISLYQKTTSTISFKRTNFVNNDISYRLNFHFSCFGYWK